MAAVKAPSNQNTNLMTEGSMASELQAQLDKQKYPKKQLHTLFYLIWMAKVRKKTFS